MRAVNKLLRKTGINKQLISKYDMGPLEKWYANDASVRNYYSDYFEEYCIIVIRISYKRLIILREKIFLIISKKIIILILLFV